MRKTLLRLATLALLFTGVAAAQSTGSITGVVTDGATGKPVVGAVVVATSPAAPGEQTAVTDAKGAFTIGNLPAGKYKLQASLEGYKPEARSDLTLGENVTLRANLAVVPEAVQLEEVVVTGSRIKRKDLTTPAPVSVINKEQMVTSGKIALGDFLQTMPEQGNTVNAQVNNGNDGAVLVNLRSIGADRTLVLVNGRRMLGNGAVDLGTIPAAAVERIEVLKDGASAVYGSDAVGGVVNVILKKRMNGTEASAYAGTSSRGDGTVYEVSATTGTGNEKGNLLFSLGYQQSGSLMAQDRAFAFQSIDYNFQTGVRTPGGNSSTFPAGRFSLPSAACSAAALGAITDPVLLALRQSACAARTAALNNPAVGAGIVVPTWDGAATGWNPVNPTGTGATTGYTGYDASLFNTNPTNYILTPARRVQLFSSGDASLGSAARAYYEASFSDRYSAYTLAPMPLTNVYGAGNVVRVSRDSIYNPFGVDITSWRHRTVEFGDRYWKVNNDALHAVVGVNGTLGDVFGPLKGWSWDANYNAGLSWQTTTSTGQLIMSRVAAATGPSMLDAAGRPVCVQVAGQISTRIAGCVPMNVLGGNGAISAAAKDYVAFDGIERNSTTMQMGSVSTSGELFKLMADRPVGLALGLEHRKESLSYTPDPITAHLDSSGNNALPSNGSFNVTEGYAELLIPLLSNLPYAEDLEVQLATRAFDYNMFGTGATYKVGARYSPVRDATIRATWSTANRAPSVNDLFAGSQDSYPTVRDPCNGSLTTKSEITRNMCLAQGVPMAGSSDPATQLLEHWLSNRDLKPEKAKTLTVGLVLEPRWVPNLSVTLDYYKVKVTDAIALYGAAIILNGCYDQGNLAMCSLINRSATGQVNWIDDPRSNLQVFDTSGLDFSLRYAVPTAAAGRFSFGFDGNLLQAYKFTDSGGTVYSGKGNYDLGILPALKANLGVNWKLDAFGAGAMVRYVGGLKECASGACSQDGTDARQVPAYAPVNLYVAYDLKSVAGTTKLLAGVQNAFDQQPPYLYNAANANSDPYTYDYIGRYYYLRLSQSF